MWQDNIVKAETGLEAGAMVGMAEGLDEEDEEEVQKVEHWTNTLIKQGSFEGSAHLKDVANWQRDIPSGPLSGVIPWAAFSNLHAHDTRQTRTLIQNSVHGYILQPLGRTSY